MYHSAKANLFSIQELATIPAGGRWRRPSSEDHTATWTGEGSTAEADLALLFASVYRTGHSQRRQQSVGGLDLQGTAG
jgi:hypothetical protein